MVIQTFSIFRLPGKWILFSLMLCYVWLNVSLFVTRYHHFNWRSMILQLFQKFIIVHALEQSYRNYIGEVSVQFVLFVEFLRTTLKHLACRKKETPTQVFSCEYYEIFKNRFFLEHLWWLILKKTIQGPIWAPVKHL